MAALSSGILLVFEAVFLPFFFQLATALRNKPPSDPKSIAFQADFEQFKTRVGEMRNAAAHVADGTRPNA